jgi:Bacterial Ig-like domain (group 3)
MSCNLLRGHERRQQHVDNDSTDGFAGDNSNDAGSFDCRHHRLRNSGYVDSQRNATHGRQPDGDGRAVRFDDGTTELGTEPISSTGAASIIVSDFGPGAHTLTAVYEGDTHFTTSTSIPVHLTVNPAPIAVSRVSSLNASDPRSDGDVHGDRAHCSYRDHSVQERCGGPGPRCLSREESRLSRSAL